MYIERKLFHLIGYDSFLMKKIKISHSFVLFLSVGLTPPFLLKFISIIIIPWPVLYLSTL